MLFIWLITSMFFDKTLGFLYYVSCSMIWLQLHTINLYYAYYSDVIMGTITSEITSLTIVYATVYSEADQRKHQSSASLVFVREFTGDRWIPRTNGQLRGRCFHLMTSSWSVSRLARRNAWRIQVSSIGDTSSHITVISIFVCHFLKHGSGKPLVIWWITPEGWCHEVKWQCRVDMFPAIK